MSGARGLAWQVLVRVERDRAWADLALHAALRDAGLERRDRALATELCYGTLRMRGRLDFALGLALDRPIDRTQADLRNLLRLGAYQLMFMDSARDATVVDESVKLARGGRLERAAGLVNAVLRRLATLHEQGGIAWPKLEEDPLGHLTSWGSLPDWLARRWLEQFGPAEAAALAEKCAGPPPRSVRLSPGVDPAPILKRLRGHRGRLAPDALVGLARDPVRDPAFDAGELTIQDEASQLVPLLLDAREGDTVVDCCAAPGTKSVQIAQQVGPRGEVIALELHDRRIGLIVRNAKRLGLSNVRALTRDVTKGFDLRGPLRYRRILVDAPCSGLGTLRRNPDARWHLREEDIARSAELQRSILASAARYVEPGGVLVYSVCTFTPEETTAVVQRFLARQRDFRIDDPRPFLPEGARRCVDASNALTTLPHRDDCDGFWAVRLVRS